MKLKCFSKGRQEDMPCSSLQFTFSFSFPQSGCTMNLSPTPALNSNQCHLLPEATTIRCFLQGLAILCFSKPYESSSRPPPPTSSLSLRSPIILWHSVHDSVFSSCNERCLLAGCFSCSVLTITVWYIMSTQWKGLANIVEYMNVFKILNVLNKLLKKLRIKG